MTEAGRIPAASQAAVVAALGADHPVAADPARLDALIQDIADLVVRLVQLNAPRVIWGANETARDFCQIGSKLHSRAQDPRARRYLEQIFAQALGLGQDLPRDGLDRLAERLISTQPDDILGYEFGRRAMRRAIIDAGLRWWLNFDVPPCAYNEKNPRPMQRLLELIYVAAGLYNDDGSIRHGFGLRRILADISAKV